MNLNEKQLDAQRRELQERERFIEDKTKLLEEKEKKIQQQLTPSTPQKIYGPPMVPSTTSNPHGMLPTGFQFPGISSQGIFPIGPYDPSALMQPSSPLSPNTEFHAQSLYGLTIVFILTGKNFLHSQVCSNDN